MLARAENEYRKERAYVVPDRLLSEIGVSRARAGQLFLPNPAWLTSANKLSLLGYGFFPKQSLAGAATEDETNNVVIFDPENPEAVKFKEIAGEEDSFLYVSQPAEPAAGQRTFYISTEHIGIINPSDPNRESPQLVAAARSVSLRGFDEDFALILDANNNFHFSTVLNGEYALFNVDMQALRIAKPESFPDEAKLKARLDELIAVSENDKGRFSLSRDGNRESWGYDRRVADAPPKFFGRPMPMSGLNANEISLSAVEVPILPGESRMVVWGTDRAIRVVRDDKDSNSIVCTRPVSSDAQRMNITADGEFLAVAHGDGVIRWYGLGFEPSDCLPPVFSFYATQADGRWGFLAWRPDGKYAIDGAIGADELACYPVRQQDGLSSCIDIRQNRSLYAPSAVRSALREAPRLRARQRADSNMGAGLVRRAAVFMPGAGLTAPAHAEAATQPAQAADPVPEIKQPAVSGNETRISVDLRPPYIVDKDEIVMGATLGEWTDGKPRYLLFTANEHAVTIVYGGKSYADGLPLPVHSNEDLSLTLSVPKAVQATDAGPFQLCQFVYGALLANGLPDPATLEPSKKGPCVSVKWSGSGKQVKRKLWALLIGFSRSTANPLQYAHEDALNFARFLERDFDHKLSASTEGSTAFDDMKIMLFIAPPGDPDPDAINQNEKLKQLHTDLGDARFELVPDQGPYHDVVLAKIHDLNDQILNFKRDHEDEPWESEVLVFFAGHGASSDDSVISFETPTVDDQRRFGFLSFERIVAGFSNAQLGVVRRIFIIDACRPNRQDNIDTDSFSQTASATYSEKRTKWDYYFSTRRGGYSYEQKKLGTNDIVQGFELWPDSFARSGSGLFTLGFLTSLICGDGMDYPGEKAYNADISERYLNNHFFAPSNQNWVNSELGIADDLRLRGLPFVKPEPEYINGGLDSRRKSFVFRTLSAKPKRCFAAD